MHEVKVDDKNEYLNKLLLNMTMHILRHAS
jgi:hypothetical protein